MRYCITLDSDTRLPRDAARQLDRHHHASAEPAGVRSAVGRVTEGYGILQPRVSVTFTSAAGSLFARLYAGHTGVDPYTTAVSDTYQDLFGEGIFTGKGLYDVDAFTAALEDSVPENALLSHDLFEGLHARVALVSDVELVDEYPSSVLAHARRQHRWIRGDWQILLWLFPFVPTRHGIEAQHAAADRPLEDPRQPPPQPRRADAAGAARRRLDDPAGSPTGSGRWRCWASWRRSCCRWSRGCSSGRAGRSRSRCSGGTCARDSATALAQIVLGVTFLAYHAWETVHAIVLTLVRLAITRRRLLEWETAAAAAARAAGLVGGRALLRFAVEMIASPIIAVAVALLDRRSLHRRRAAVGAAVPAAVARSRPASPTGSACRSDRATRPLSRPRAALLRRTARKTWRYFETFVTAADGWLPPDNYQEEATSRRLARRTSPTNIGMGLLSTLAAHDLGYRPDRRR